jgi:hypothetical protein
VRLPREGTLESRSRHHSFFLTSSRGIPSGFRGGYAEVFPFPFIPPKGSSRKGIVFGKVNVLFGPFRRRGRREHWVLRCPFPILGSGDPWFGRGLDPINGSQVPFPEGKGSIDPRPGSSISHFDVPGGTSRRGISGPWIVCFPAPASLNAEALGDLCSFKTPKGLSSRPVPRRSRGTIRNGCWG